MRHLFMGVAAIAMAVSASHANPGKGNTNGNGNANNNNSATAAKLSGNRNAASSRTANGSNKVKSGEQAERGKGNSKAANISRTSPANRGNRNAGSTGNGNGNSSAARSAERTQGNRNTDIRVVNGNARGTARLPVVAGARNLVQGCPPGLAKKRNGCLPPGHAKQNNYGYLPSLFALGDLRSGNYFYNDGYLLQSADDGIAAWLPLLGGALAVGSEWPSGYDSSPLPGYYENYYRLGAQNSYRYADGVVYRVDPETTAISSIAALLTGDNFAVGQPVPAGYDVYNVPRAYQDRYLDQPGRQYRYSDGYVYQIDPETRLVAAAIELLV